MADDDETCPDFHICRNGAKCVESDIAEGKFYCDCDRIDLQRAEEASSYAGISCEHEATLYCNADNRKSFTSFCTNGGTCKRLVDVNDKHEGCECPRPYTGRFCEFLIGQKVPEHMDPNGDAAVNPVSHAPQNNNGALKLVAISLFLTVVVTAVLAAYFVLQIKRSNKRLQQQQQSSMAVEEEQSPSSASMPMSFASRGKRARKPWDAVTGQDLTLEADGSVLQEALHSLPAGRSPTAPPPPLAASPSAADDELDEPPQDPTFVIDDAAKHDENNAPPHNIDEDIEGQDRAIV